MRLVVALLACVVTACTVEIGARPRPPGAPPSEPELGLSISSRTLANGLRVVVVRDPTASDVQVTMRYQVGAVDDGASPGIAHLVEHLMFQQDVGGEPLFTQVEDVATYFNAATTLDATTYVARAPTAALGKLLGFEAIRLQQRCGTLTDATFEREREVVVHEVEQRDVASEIFGALHRALYPEGHPYQRSVGGTVDSVRSITRAQACAFADRYYAPNNAVLVISGNLTARELAGALADLSGRVTRRVVAIPTRPTPPPIRPQHLEVTTSIDHDVLVVAWPLPRDPEVQARVRALASALPNLVEHEIKGTAIAIELGDRSAPMIGIAAVPGDDETFKNVIDGTREAVAKLPRLFDEVTPEHLDQIVFEKITHGAVYTMYSQLEDGGGRDERLASYVAAGRDPRTAILDDIAAVSELTPDEAADLAAKYLSPNTPSVVTLKASAAKKRGEKLTIHKPIHDLGPRRAPVDPALASRAVQSHAATATLAARTRTLPNGLKVILLPVTAVPTVDARLIFRAGTADEPFDQRGVAVFAAHTLTWNLRHYHDFLAFARAGGMHDTDVGTDRTTFSVQGLDTNLDVILAGLRRWVRDGVYDDSAQSFANTMHSLARRVDDQGPLTDAWRAALFGPKHPYVAAGLMRLADPAITLDQASAFRTAYYTPDNATLVISGSFDAALADQWIDFLFADWQGHAVGHNQVAASPTPATVAKADDTTLVQVRLAIPVASANGRAQHLVLAEMLNDIARDVRFQLAASYSFGAQLAETRQASFLVISGWVDAARTTAAVELVRDRVAELTSDPTAAARAFVVARAHVATRLRARVGSAAALADRVEHDIELGRDPLSDLNLAATVESLTIKDMAGALRELDLSRATLLMDGPQEDVGSAVKALGRDATYLGPAQAPPVTSAPGMTVDYVNAEQRVLRAELEPALTARPMPQLMLAASVNASLGTVSDEDASFLGYTFAGELGYRYGWTNALGARLEVGRLTMSYSDGSAMHEVALVPVDALALWHLGGRRAWAAVMVGLHLEQLGDASTWRTAPVYGFEGGYDLLQRGDHRIGVAVRWESASQSDRSYSSLAIGLTYRQ